jgi:hypothetical protein
VIAPVVAIIDWRAAAPLKDNAIFLRRAGLLDEQRPRRRSRTVGQRSLIVRADGSGELQRFAPGTMARRLLAAAGGRTAGETRTKQRG